MFRLLIAGFAFVSSVWAVDTEDLVRKSVPLTSATRLRLNVEFGSVRVMPGTEGRAGVEVYFRGVPPNQGEFDQMLRDFKLDVREQVSDVIVSATFVDGWIPRSPFEFFKPGHPICDNWRCLKYSRWLREVEFRVTVPRQFDADVTTRGNSISVRDLKGEVNARTSGGSIQLEHIEGPVNGRTSGGSIALVGGAGSAVVRTSGGSILVSQVKGDVDASTSGGSISIERSSGRVIARTSGGRILLREITGSVDASTSGGAVTASLLAQPTGDCRLSTSGGSIHVSAPKDVRVNLDASTSGGSVATDFPVPRAGDRQRRELRAPLNGGGPLLYLHTSGGGIDVRYAGS